MNLLPLAPDKREAIFDDSTACRPKSRITERGIRRVLRIVRRVAQRRWLNRAADQIQSELKLPQLKLRSNDEAIALVDSAMYLD